MMTKYITHKDLITYLKANLSHIGPHISLRDFVMQPQTRGVWKYKKQGHKIMHTQYYTVKGK